MSSTAVALGLDFGTQSVRAVLIDAAGREHAIASHDYAHGQIIDRLPGTDQSLPPRYALQCPADWIDSATAATRQAIADSGLDPGNIVGIGVDFTSCTMLPTTVDGTPLCQLEQFRAEPLAWAKLWKHHGAGPQAERMTAIARDRGEAFLSRCGGSIGLEWFFPKILETIENAPEVARAAEVWIEAGDWFVWQLTGGPADQLARSTCQAGYKAMWTAEDGYPTDEYLTTVDPRLAAAAKTRMPGRLLSPGQSAGVFQPAMAKRFGLPSGIAVSAAIIDAHAAVPGVGAGEPGVLVMVMGTSSCHMLNATHFADIPGVAGVVRGGILSGLYGYETGQAAVGDAFDWLRRLLGLEQLETVAAAAARLPPGADGVGCVDWFAGCRTPLMDGSLRGAFTGLSLHHRPEHLYAAMAEASAFGIRWIVELLTAGGLPIDRIVATGGLPHHNRHLVQIYADVLGRTIEIHPATQGSAVGASVLGMSAAAPPSVGFDSIAGAAAAMAGGGDRTSVLIEPRVEHSETYRKLYERYRSTAEALRNTHPTSQPPQP